MASRPTTEAQVSPRRYRFASYELDARTGELHKLGTRLRLQEQPLQILLALLESPGEMVSREQLTTRLWPAGTFVDFDLGLNAAVRRLRDLLNDSAENPRYIETLPRLGYRFIAAVEVVAEPETTPLPVAQEERGGEQTAPAGAWRWSPRVAIAAGLLLLTLATGLGAWRWTQPRATVQFSHRDWVLISQFENRTGEPLFNDTLEYALQSELSNSQFVNAVPRERIQDTLLLMKRPLDTRLDASLAREVAVRDGNVQIVLTGRTEKVASTYLLSASLIDPTTGATLRSFSEQALSQDAVLLAVRRLSNDVRSSLGEELRRVGHDNEALEKATTSSLRALHLYSQGMALVNQGQWAAAAQLFEQALAVDPDFASAHIYLAHCYSNLGNEKQAAPHYRQALRLADSTTNRERYFILGSYHNRFSRDDDKAIAAYQVLVRLYPDHYWGVNNLAGTLSALGRIEEAAPYLVASADLRPNDFGSNYEAWEVSRRFGQDSPTTKRLKKRILRLASSEPVRAAFSQEWAELQLVPARERLEKGELAQSLSEVDRVAGTLTTHHGPARTMLAWYVGVAYQSLGRLRQAEALYLSLPADYRYWELARLAELRGDRRAMRQHLREQLTAAPEVSHGPGTAARLARAGMLSESEQLISRLVGWGYPKHRVDHARGELALARGHVPKAVRLLRSSFDSLDKRRDNRALMTSESFARALVAQGDLTGAVQVLNVGITEYMTTIDVADVPQYRYELLQLYRKLGRQEEARKTEAEIRAMLTVADADHPVLVALDHQQELGRAANIRDTKHQQIVSKR